MTIYAKRDVCFACVTYAHAHFFHVDAYIVSFFLCKVIYFFTATYVQNRGPLCRENTVWEDESKNRRRTRAYCDSSMTYTEKFN